MLPAAADKRTTDGFSTAAAEKYATSNQLLQQQTSNQSVRLTFLFEIIYEIMCAVL